MIFPVNDFPVLLITDCYMLDVKGCLDSPLHAIRQIYKSSKLIILSVFKYKMSRFLKFWCKLNTHEIFKACLFCFLRDYYGDSLDAMFPQFPDHFLPFPVVFPHVFPSLSTFFLGVSTVSSQCFPHFLFQISRYVEPCQVCMMERLRKK